MTIFRWVPEKDLEEEPLACEIDCPEDAEIVIKGVTSGVEPLKLSRDIKQDETVIYQSYSMERSGKAMYIKFLKDVSVDDRMFIYNPIAHGKNFFSIVSSTKIVVNQDIGAEEPFIIFRC